MNMEKDSKFMACVLSMTFNQDRYIEDTLNGFCIQQTDFPFVCVIVDDASTDGEQRVIDKYLEHNFNLDDDVTVLHEETDDYNMVYARHKENRNCYFVIYYLKYNHYSINKGKGLYYSEWRKKVKYVAECEGDDYWIDPLKLQKQVDFLETHPDYGLVHTNRYNLIGDTLIKVKARSNYDAISVLLRTGIATLTTCYRSDLHFKYLEEVQPQNKGWLMGDSPFWKYIAFKSKIHLLPDYTAVYRILPESASHSKDIEKRVSFVNSILDIQEYMLEQYVKDPQKKKRIKSKIVSDYHLRCFNILISMGKKGEAKSYFKQNYKNIKKCDLISLFQIRVFISAFLFSR